MSKELDYINYCIVENECHIKRLDTTGYPVEIQKQYSDYLFKKREILSTIKQALTTKSKKEQAFDIIKEYQVDTWLLNQCDYENYIRIRKEARVSIGQIINEDGKSVEEEISEVEFNLVKEVLNDNSQE
jgi:hypothetical protein